MMKILKNEKLSRWVIGIVIAGLVMAYVPLLFVPASPSQDVPTSPTPEPLPVQNMETPVPLPEEVPNITITTSSIEEITVSTTTSTEPGR